MSLLGEKGERGGRRTRHREDDHPVCEACAQEMALLVEASADSQKLCPSDGQKMAKEIAHMLVIDRCPKCQGVWLDGGELERIQSASQEAILRTMTVSFSHP